MSPTVYPAAVPDALTLWRWTCSFICQSLIKAMCNLQRRHRGEKVGELKKVKGAGPNRAHNTCEEEDQTTCNHVGSGTESDCRSVPPGPITGHHHLPPLTFLVLTVDWQQSPPSQLQKALLLTASQQLSPMNGWKRKGASVRHKAKKLKPLQQRKHFSVQFQIILRPLDVCVCTLKFPHLSA